MSGDLAEIKQALLDRIEEVCQRLLPDGRREGGLWVSFNPVEGDRKAGREPALKVRIRGGDLGAWRDWRSGAKGDVLRLVSYLEGTDTAGALTWSRDFLGLRAMSREDRERMRRVAAERKRQAEDRAVDAHLYKLDTALKLYEAKPGDRPVGPALCPQGSFAFGAASPAEQHARAYFSARSVPVDDLAARYTFRFSPATEWWKGARYESFGDGRRRRIEAGPLFPSIHSAMRGWNGTVQCCHVTFLDPARPAKAPVKPAKLMWGEAKGAVIEVAAGPTGKPFWMTEEPSPLVIAEGIETALSFAVSVPEARVWAGGSLAGIGSAPVHLPCVSWVLFARDNNEGNRQAQKQFEAALAGLEASGKRVVVEASHVGDDFNDLATGKDEP